MRKTPTTLVTTGALAAVGGEASARSKASPAHRARFGGPSRWKGAQLC